MGPFHVEITSHSPEETREIGACLGELAQAGDVFLLIGDLGTGKTCLTQGIARGLGVPGLPMSPSFVLVREHKGRLPLYHMDLYRIGRVEEVSELGLEDYLMGQGLVVVEWADRAREAFPPDHLLITLTHRSEEERQLHLEARGERYQELIMKLQERFPEVRHGTGH